MKVWDHVDVLCLVSFDEFIKDLKETRKAIMEKYPETKKSKFKISVGPFNHCVHAVSYTHLTLPTKRIV